MAVFRSRGTMPVVSVVGMGSSSQDLAGALLIIFFKTDSSATGSKVIKRFPAKEVSG